MKTKPGEESNDNLQTANIDLGEDDPDKDGAAAGDDDGDDDEDADEGADNTDNDEAGDDDEDAEGDDEGEAAADKAKADTKAEKRIKSLTAQIKASDEENQRIRDENTYLQTKLEKAEEKYLKAELPLYNGRPLHLISDKDFADALDRLTSHPDLTDEQKVATTRHAVAERKAAKADRENADKLARNEQALWAKDWGIVQANLTDPEIVGKVAAKVFKDNATRIKAAIQEEMDDSEYLRTTLANGNAAVKFEHTWKVIKRLGLDKKAQIEAYREDRPGLKTQVGQPGRKTSGASGGTKPFTRAQIDKMSLAEYLKNEKAIDTQMAAGLIK